LFLLPASALSVNHNIADMSAEHVKNLHQFVESFSAFVWKFQTPRAQNFILHFSERQRME